MKRTIILSLFISLFIRQVFAGDFIYSKPELTGKFRGLIGTDSEFTYMTRIKGKKMMIQKHKNSNSRPILEKEINFQSSVKDLEFLTSFSANNKVYIVTTFLNKAEKTADYYLHRLSSNLTLSKPLYIGKTIATRSFSFNKRANYDFSSISLSISNSGQIMNAFSYVGDRKNKMKERQNVLFDENGDKLETTNFKLRYFNDEFVVLNSDIDNNGNLYILGYNSPEEGFSIFGRSSFSKDVWLYSVDKKTGKVSEVIVDITENCMDLNLKITDNKTLVITGLTGNNSSGVTGAICIVFDKLLTEINRSSHKFEEAFITKSWTEKELKKLDKKQDRASKSGKNDPDLDRYRYKLDYVFERKNGDITLFGEQYKVVKKTTTSRDATTGATTTRVNYDYFYKDIVIVTFNSEGNFIRKTSIQKEQRDRDKTLYLSYFPFIDGNNISLVYSERSYKEKRSFRKIKRVTILEDGALEKGYINNLSKGESHKLIINECYQTNDGTTVLYILPRKGTRIGIMTQS